MLKMRKMLKLTIMILQKNDKNEEIMKFTIKLCKISIKMRKIT